MGADARGFRQQVVMHVEHGAAADVGQRRQFVHPAPVVALVVVVLLLRVPPGEQQRAFDLAQLGARHQNVDVAKQTARRRRQVGDGIGGALEQQSGAVDIRQSLRYAPCFPTDSLTLLGGHGTGSGQVRSHRIRQAGIQAKGFGLHGEPGQQPGRAGLAQQQVPACQVERGHACGIAQDIEQGLAVHAANSANTCSASSRFEYSKSWHSQASISAALSSKPRPPSRL